MTRAYGPGRWPYADRLDPRTPVVVGVGQSSERLGEPGYRAGSPAQLGAEAARRALEDSGADPVALAAAIDTVAGVRQLELSLPGTWSPLGRSDNFPRSVARRVGAAPTRAILEVAGGQSPQHLVTEMARTIAGGGSEVALVVGGEAISTALALAGAQDPPDWTEHPGGSLEDRGPGLHELVPAGFAAAGPADVPGMYALFENARRARLGLSRAEYATAMGRLFAPFTTVAAGNPHAAAPVERSAHELVTPSDRNRPVADPYVRFLVARDKVNQGAAALLVSVAAARRLGVPEDRWVFQHGHADLRERELMDRADLGRSPAAVLAVRHALDVAGRHLGAMRTLDLYSCFPVAVLNLCDAFELHADDPRGLTLTGGLPFFGGAGNDYSMHAIAETVQRARSTPGSHGLVGANGGLLSKYSVGVYSTQPTPWTEDESGRVQAEIDGWPAVATAERADGWATVETWTVQHDRDGGRTGIVVGRLESNGRRFVARTVEGDEEMLALLAGEQPVGRRVRVRCLGAGNLVTATGERIR